MIVVSWPNMMLNDRMITEVQLTMTVCSSELRSIANQQVVKELRPVLELIKHCLA